MHGVAWRKGGGEGAIFSSGVLSISIRLGMAHRPTDPEMKLGLAYGKGFRPAGQRESSLLGLVLAQPCYTPEHWPARGLASFSFPPSLGKGTLGRRNQHEQKLRD